jgi:hypothetical protein
MIDSLPGSKRRRRQKRRQLVVAALCEEVAGACQYLFTVSL